MNSDFIFRSGKFKGKSYGWVEAYQPWYIRWVLENRPEMLKEHKPNIVKVQSETEDENEKTISDRQYRKSKLMTPNLDFFKEKGLGLNED